MSLQQSVEFQTGFGVVGEFYDNSPSIVAPWLIESPNAANNVFGRAFTATSGTVDNTAQAGRSAFGLFAGILIAPKDHALYGVPGNPLAPSLTLPNNVTAQLATMGHIIVTLANPAKIGDRIIYDNTTGVLDAIDPATPIPVGSSDAYAFVINYAINSAPSLAVIQLNYVPTYA